MDKQDFLSLVRAQVEKGVATRADVLSALDATPVVTSGAGELRDDSGASRIALALYAIGFLIVAVGVCLAVADNWDTLGATGRILVTLGIGVATLVGGTLVSTNRSNGMLAQALQAIAAVLVPIGTFVAFNEFSYEPSDFALGVTYAVIAASFYGAYMHGRTPISLLATLVGAAVSYFAFLSAIVSDRVLYSEVFDLACIALGVGYMALAFIMPQGAGELRGTSTVRSIILSGGLLLTTVPLFDFGSAFMNLALSIAAIAGMYVMIAARSGLGFAVASLVLIATIMKIVGEYFFDSFGPYLGLIVMGFIIIGVGYMTINIYRRRIAVPKA